MGRKAQLKTVRNDRSVAAFLARQPAARRADCERLVDLMAAATGAPPAMWGASIVGFGTYTYPGRSGESAWFLTGFSPRVQNLTLYLMSGVERYPDLLARLGPHTTGKSCLYLRRLADVDGGALGDLIRASVRDLAVRRAGG